MAGNINQTRIEKITNKQYNDSENSISIVPASSVNKSVIINNTLKVSHTHDQSGRDGSQALIERNATSTIHIKDRDDGEFKPVYVDENTLYITPITNGVSGANEKFITNDNLKEELELISGDPDDLLVFSNIHLSNVGTFYLLENNEAQPDSLSNTVGFRQSGGTIQYKNHGDTGWRNLVTTSEAATLLNDLGDVDITSVNDNDILVFDSATSNFSNESFAVSLDSTPTLGGNLSTDGNHIKFNDNTGLIDSSGNIVAVINSSNTTNENYFKIQHIDLGSDDKIPELTVDGTADDIDIQLSAKGDGDLYLNASNIYLNTLTNLSFNSGFMQKSIYTITESGLSTTEGSPTTISASTNILVFNIGGDDGVYYTTLNSGLNGQAYDVIYESSGSNNTVNVNFNDGGSPAKVGTGSGLYDRLIFSTPGQSSSIVYLGSLGGSRNRWQVTNSGALVA